MSNNNFLTKCLKVVTYALGFPLMLALIIGFLIPVTQDAALGNYGRDWIIIMFAVWAIIAVAEALIMKFYGNKSEKNHTIALLILSVLTIVLVVVPVEGTNARVMKEYNAAKGAVEKEYGVTLDSYGKIQGWARPVTGCGTSAETYVADVDAFMAKYGLTSMDSFDLGHYDSETKQGHIKGVYEEVDYLINHKKDCIDQIDISKKAIEDLKAKYPELQKAIDEAVASYDAAALEYNAKNTAYNTANSAYTKANKPNKDLETADKNVRTYQGKFDKAKTAYDNAVAAGKTEEELKPLKDALDKAQKDLDGKKAIQAEKKAVVDALTEEDLANIQKALDDKNKAFTEKNNANNAKKAADNVVNAKKAAYAANTEEISKYEGRKIVLAGHKEEVVTYLLGLLSQSNMDKIFPNKTGIMVPVPTDFAGDLVDLSDLIGQLGPLVGMVAKDPIINLIPDEILFGLNPESIPYCNSQINGSATEMSLAEVEKLNVEIEYNPEIIVLGIVRYLVYVCVGLVILSLVTYENIKFKQMKKEA